MTVYRFAWDVDGAYWQGAIPICPSCEEPVSDSRRVPIVTDFAQQQHVECDCGASWPVSGETVEIPTAVQA